MSSGNNWGGRREGAGRPAVEKKKVSFTVRVHPDVASWMDREAKRREVSKGVLLEMIVNEFIDGDSGTEL